MLFSVLDLDPFQVAVSAFGIGDESHDPDSGGFVFSDRDIK